MRTRLPIVVGSIYLALGLALTGCSRPIGEEGMQVESESPVEMADDRAEAKVLEQPAGPGMYFAGEFVPFEAREPGDPEPDLIEACEEIPDEVFAAAGLDPDTKRQRNSDGHAICFIDLFDHPSASLSVMIHVNGGVIEGISTVTGQLDRRPVGVPTAVFQGTAHKEEGRCNLAVDTLRGAMAVAVDDDFDRLPFEQRCDLAEHIFQTIYEHLGV